MNRFLFGLITLGTLVASAQPAPAQYRYTYSQPCTTHCAATYSAWAYWVYPQTNYYYRVRYRFAGGYRYLEDDGWLYTVANGCYHQHCKIADYIAKVTVELKPAAKLDVLGTTDYGLDPTKLAIVKAYGTKYAGLLQQQGSPSPLDVASILVPASTSRTAIIESVSKQSTSASDLMAQVLTSEQATERANIEARRQLALQANQFQAMERWIGQLKDLSAINAQQATVSAAATAQQIQVGDPVLAQVISTSCFRCHGGDSVKGNLDFKAAASWDAAQWKLIARQVGRRKMPPAGEPQLEEVQIDLFESHYDQLLAR